MVRRVTHCPISALYLSRADRTSGLVTMGPRESKRESRFLVAAVSSPAVDGVIDETSGDGEDPSHAATTPDASDAATAVRPHAHDDDDDDDDVDAVIRDSGRALRANAAAKGELCSMVDVVTAFPLQRQTRPRPWQSRVSRVTQGSSFQHMVSASSGTLRTIAGNERLRYTS
jgi:hypothetical protein